MALRRYEVALHELEAALSDDRRPLTAAQHTEVADLITWIRTSLPTLRLQLTPKTALASIDDLEVESGDIRLDAGLHRLQVTAPGYQPHSDAFSLSPGERATLRVALIPLPETLASQVAPPNAPQPGSAPVASTSAPPERDSSALYERWWFWTAVGAVVAGGVITAVALSAKPDSKPYERSELGVISIR